MASDEVLAQVARDVARLQTKVHMLESVTRPQFKGTIAAIFKTDLSIAVVLLLPKYASSQEKLASHVSKLIGRRVHQVTVGRQLTRLKSLGVLSQTKSRTFSIEPAWIEAGLEAELRKKAKGMGLKVAPRRRKTSR